MRVLAEIRLVWVSLKACRWCTAKGFVINQARTSSSPRKSPDEYRSSNTVRATVQDRLISSLTASTTFALWADNCTRATAVRLFRGIHVVTTGLYNTHGSTAIRIAQHGTFEHCFSDRNRKCLWVRYTFRI